MIQKYQRNNIMEFYMELIKQNIVRKDLPHILVEYFIMG